MREEIAELRIGPIQSEEAQRRALEEIERKINEIVRLLNEGATT